MKAIYNKNNGEILVYADEGKNIDALKSNWPGEAESIDIDFIPPKQELGQWHVNLETLILEKI